MKKDCGNCKKRHLQYFERPCYDCKRNPRLSDAWEADLHDIAIDTPVWVHSDTVMPLRPYWRIRHFAGWSDDGKMLCYINGYTSYTAPISKNSKLVHAWEEWSLVDPTEEVAP